MQGLTTSGGPVDIEVLLQSHTQAKHSRFLTTIQTDMLTISLYAYGIYADC